MSNEINEQAKTSTLDRAAEFSQWLDAQLLALEIAYADWVTPKSEQRELMGDR